MIRLFAALPLPDELRTRIGGLQGGIDGANWVPPENLHITLRFIGEVPEDRGEDIVAALDGVRWPDFPVTLDGTGHFGTGDRARAIWVGVRKSGALAGLHEKIEAALVRVGFPPEGRKFTPHVTVARLKHAKANRVVRWLEASGAFVAPPFAAREFTLYESRLGRHGPVYTPLAAFPLD